MVVADYRSVLLFLTRNMTELGTEPEMNLM